MNEAGETLGIFPSREVRADSAQSARDQDRRGWRALVDSPRALTLVFFILCVARILLHGMWRDELQAWSIAHHSASLRELLYNCRYEGHPALWFLILYALKHLTDTPVAMQLFHAIVASGVVYVVFRYAPFAWWQKILFALGYFPFFEYAVVSRCYALGILGFFAGCALYFRRRENVLTLACILFLMCQTSAYGVILALALAAACGWDWLKLRAGGDARFIGRAALVRTALATAILVAGVGLSAWQMRPPSDNTIVASGAPHLSEHRAERVIADVWYGYTAMRLPWTSERKESANLVKDAQIAFAIPMLILAGFLVVRSPVAFVLLACGTLGQLVFKYQFHPGATRHHGHLLIVLVGAFWFRNATAPGELLAPARFALLRWIDARRDAIFGAVLVVQALAGVAAAGLDIVIPFSAARDTARFVGTHFPKDAVLVGDDDVRTSPIAAYLRRDLYYPAREQFGSFIQWDTRRHDVKREDLFDQVKALRERYPGRPIVLVLTYKFARKVNGLEFVQSFTRSVRREETYHVYRVTGDPAFAEVPPATSRP